MLVVSTERGNGSLSVTAPSNVVKSKELLYVLSELCVVWFMFLWCRWWGLCCCRVFSIDFFKAC